jgi:hypothetical protein
LNDFVNGGLGGCQFSLAGEAFSAALPQIPALQLLQIHQSKHFGDSGMAALALALPRLPVLAGLELIEDGIGDVGARALAQVIQTAVLMTRRARHLPATASQ